MPPKTSWIRVLNDLADSNLWLCISLMLISGVHLMLRVVHVLVTATFRQIRNRNISQMKYRVDIKWAVSYCCWRILSPKTRAWLMLMSYTRYTVRISHVPITRTYFRNVCQERVTNNASTIVITVKCLVDFECLTREFNCVSSIYYNISVNQILFKPYWTYITACVLYTEPETRT